MAERDSSVATDEPRNSPALTVTFDTNTLASVVWPENPQCENAEAAITVQAAVQDGRIRGFFSETVITLEGVLNYERSEILGKTRVMVDVTASGENHPGGKVNFGFSVGSKHVRNPLNPQFLARIRGALNLGMLPLQTIALFTRRHDDRFPLFRPAGGNDELLRCMDKVNALTLEIMNRGFGQAVARDIGVRFSERRESTTEPELWHQGLGRARNPAEKKKVAKAIREWADGDSVGAHYGFGIQLFCTNDFGGAGPSVLDHNNRKWLNEEFGIEFVTLIELAQKVTE